MRAGPDATWLLAQPTTGETRAGDPMADPAFHHAMAARLSPGSPARAILLDERLARSRGPGGRTVAGSWADSGVQVTVIADADPRHQSGTRRLLVDGADAVEQWARNVRELGATGACWHTDLESRGTPAEDQARVTAEIAKAMARADLAPMLWIDRSGSTPHGQHALPRIRQLLDGAGAHGADLSRLTVCLAVDPPEGPLQGDLAALVAVLRLAIPACVGQVLVVVPRDRLHLAQSDAYEISHSLAQHPAPWPVAHCPGDLALRQVGGWWREPGLASRAGNRFVTILDQLATPTGPVHTHHAPAAGVPEQLDHPNTRTLRLFDTSLFRKRSLYRSRTHSQSSSQS
jgi:hypothetical protein